jgi:hypothetical protein
MANVYGWDVPEDITIPYINKCKIFAENDEEFFNFRRDPDYIKVLEGDDVQLGAFYLDRILKENYFSEFLYNLEKFKEADGYGNPLLSSYASDNTKIEGINHNTIMYAYHTLDMKSLMGAFQPERIVEIGGGYGGMCKAFSVMYDFDEYVLVDLPEVIALCKKYLGKFPNLYKKVAFLTPEDVKINNSFGDFDLSMAVFSMSECNAETQNMYADKIIMNSKYSFIGYNKMHLPGILDIYNGLINKFSGKFNISYDNLIQNIDCLYVYLNKKDLK